MMKNEEIVNYVLNKIPNILAIYLSGSRLNKLDCTDTDYDLYVITADPLAHLMTGRFRKNETHYPASEENANEIQVKVMSLRKFHNLIVKSNYNVLELLSAQPLYVSKDYEELNTWLNSKEGILTVSQINVPRFVSSILGYSKQVEREIQNGHQHRYKSLANQLKGVYYSKQLLKYGYLKNICLRNTEMYDIKNKHDMTQQQMLNRLHASVAELEEIFDSLGPFENKNAELLLAKFAPTVQKTFY